METAVLLIVGVPAIVGAHVIVYCLCMGFQKFADRLYWLFESRGPWGGSQ